MILACGGADPAIGDELGNGGSAGSTAPVASGAGPVASGGSAPIANPPQPTPPGTVPTQPQPSALRPDSVASTGFFVLNGRLYDALGNDFVMRGLNNPHIWFFDDSLDALEPIASLGSNTVRVVWETSGDANELDQVLARVIELEMIPMIELHDVTGFEDNQDLLDMALYYARPDIVAVLNRYERHLLVNVANEWSGDDFLGAYQSAVQLMRDAGIDHTIVVDANGFGQNGDVILDNGTALLELDPQHNLLFSVHMYSEYTNDAAITGMLQGAVDRRLPLIVGEFGFQFGEPPDPINFPLILSESQRLGLGYLAWSWKGNSDEVAYLDLSNDWAGNNLTSWGAGVLVSDPNGVAATSIQASVFSSGGM